jgi:hypothetical protein
MLYTSGLGNAYFFTGRRMHHFDSNLIDLGPAPNTAIQYNRARHYDPEYGRWLQRDTLGEVVRVTWGNYYKKGQPRFIGLRRSPKVYRDGMDLYQYGRSNPLKFIDPNGLVCGPAQDKLLDRLIPDRPPTWFGPCDFRSACRWHDECYGICGKTKRECDDGFWQRMEWDALFQKGPLRRCACSSLALLYHKAVVGFAQEIYGAAQKHACKEKQEEKKEPEPPHPCETIADNLYFDCMTATGGNHIQCSHDARDAFSNCMDDLEG